MKSEFQAGYLTTYLPIVFFLQLFQAFQHLPFISSQSLRNKNDSMTVATTLKISFPVSCSTSEEVGYSVSLFPTTSE